MKRLIILISIYMGIVQLSNAQFTAMNLGNDFPKLFDEYKRHDSIYNQCLEDWSTNYEWAECNSEEFQYWKKQMDIGYNEVMQKIDSGSRKEFISYHKAWLKNIEGQEVLFEKLRLDRFNGREQILTFNGLIAQQYAIHAKDLRYLAYVLSLK